jgi:hypothetical protein
MTGRNILNHSSPALARAGAGLALGAASIARPTAVIACTLALPGLAIRVRRIAWETAAATL